MISFVRVDNRLIHGQVVEAWLPHLKVRRVVVADDEAAASPLIRAAMGLAVPAQIDVRIEPRDAVPYAAWSQDDVKTLFLFRDVDDVRKAKTNGLTLERLNLGNVHFDTGRVKVSPSVFLSENEMETLKGLQAEGVEVELRAVPADHALDLPEITNRFEKGK